MIVYNYKKKNNTNSNIKSNHSNSNNGNTNNHINNINNTNNTNNNNNNQYTSISIKQTIKMNNLDSISQYNNNQNLNNKLLTNFFTHNNNSNHNSNGNTYNNTNTENTINTGISGNFNNTNTNNLDSIVEVIQSKYGNYKTHFNDIIQHNSKTKAVNLPSVYTNNGNKNSNNNSNKNNSNVLIYNINEKKHYFSQSKFYKHNNSNHTNNANTNTMHNVNTSNENYNVNINRDLNPLSLSISKIKLSNNENMEMEKMGIYCKEANKNIIQTRYIRTNNTNTNNINTIKDIALNTNNNKKIHNLNDINSKKLQQQYNITIENSNSNNNNSNKKIKNLNSLFNNSIINNCVAECEKIIVPNISNNIHTNNANNNNNNTNTNTNTNNTNKTNLIKSKTYLKKQNTANIIRTNNFNHNSSLNITNNTNTAKPNTTSKSKSKTIIKSKSVNKFLENKENTNSINNTNNLHNNILHYNINNPNLSNNPYNNTNLNNASNNPNNNPNNQFNKFIYIIKQGCNPNMIRKLFNHRLNWKESTTFLTTTFNYKWAVSRKKLEFNILSNKLSNITRDISSKRLVNHFEYENEISNKQNLLYNIIEYCESININPFNYIPLTIVLKYQSKNFNKNRLSFEAIFENIQDFLYDSNKPINKPNQNVTNVKNNLNNLQNNPVPNKKIEYSEYFSLENIIPSSQEPQISNSIIKIPNTHYTSKNLWLVKPANLYGGKCIEIIDNPYELMKLVKQFIDGIAKSFKPTITNTTTNININKINIEEEIDAVDDNDNDDDDDDINENSMDYNNNININNNNNNNEIDTNPNIQNLQNTLNINTNPNTNTNQNTNTYNIKQINSTSNKYNNKPTNKYTNTINNDENTPSYNKKKIYKSSAILLQKYIEQPFLYKNRKNDIRMWVLITHTMDIYLFKEGHLKATSSEYSTNTKDKFVHITNYSLQKYNSKFQSHEVGNEISFKEFQEELNKQNSGIEIKRDLIPQMIEIISISLKGVKNKINKKNRKECYLILGYDFMIDCNYKVWLIEINKNTGLVDSSPLISMLIPRMMDDCFRLTLDKVFPVKYSEDVLDKSVVISGASGAVFAYSGVDNKEILEENDEFYSDEDVVVENMQNSNQNNLNKKKKSKSKKKKFINKNIPYNSNNSNTNTNNSNLIYKSPFVIEEYSDYENMWEYLFNINPIN